MASLLSINNYYYRRGGAEVLFLEHNSLFEKHGWNIAPFSMQHPNNLESEWSQYFIEELEYGSDYSLYQKIRRIPKFVYSFEARNKLKAMLSSFSPDVCHVHNIYHHISPSILSLLNEKNIPVILTMHDLKLLCPAYNMLSSDGVCERCKDGNISNVIRNKCIKNSYFASSLVYAECFLHRMLDSYANNVTRFVVPSRFYLEKVKEWRGDTSQFIYVPNFVDVQSLTPCFKAGDTFVYFGRLSKEKGVRTLVEAAVKVGAQLEIVGTGPDEEQLKKTAFNSGANVRFLGYLKGDALHNVIRSARAVILPSEWYENAPLSVLEAYALGKPVIGAEIGGIPELIKEDVTGSIFESGSVDALASLLEEYMASPRDQIEDMGTNGRAWVERDFSPEKYFERISSLYSKHIVRS